MKRIFAILMVAVFMVSVMIVMTAPAFAVPGSKFGAGGSIAKPHDANAKCHPPGQTSDDRRCQVPE